MKCTLLLTGGKNPYFDLGDSAVPKLEQAVFQKE